MMEHRVHISVCICTRNRPKGLARLLNSLVAQIDAPSFNVVVVDNGDGSAADVVDSFRSSLNIVYAKEPRPGLAFSRNRTVAMADGDCIAFIDDDEDASPTWLATMLRVMETYNAVCVVGPIYIRFDDNVSVAIQYCEIFKTVLNPEGQVIPWYQTRTGNACIKKQALVNMNPPFDPRFNLTGGEDIELFKTVINAGGKIVAANAGAEVYEYRGRECANFRWVLKRSVRNGGHCADVEWAGLSFGVRCSKAWSAGLLGMRQAIQAFRMRHQNESEHLKLSLKAGENLGRFLRPIGYLYPEYKNRS